METPDGRPEVVLITEESCKAREACYPCTLLHGTFVYHRTAALRDAIHGTMKRAVADEVLKSNPSHCRNCDASMDTEEPCIGGASHQWRNLDNKLHCENCGSPLGDDGPCVSGKSHSWTFFLPLNTHVSLPLKTHVQENNALASASSGDVIRCRAPDANHSACNCCQHNFRVLDKRNALASASIPMIIWCPWCGARHIDEGEFATKPHHTHACQNCGLVWRPAVVNTVGVQFLPGYKDALIAPVCNCGYVEGDKARHSASCNVVLKRVSK